MRAWWEEDEGRRSRFFKNTLDFSEPPPATCDPRIAHIIIQQHLEAPSVWAIFPIQVCFFLLACCARRSSIWVPNERNWELVSITLSRYYSPTVVCWSVTMGKGDSKHTNMTSILFMFLHLIWLSLLYQDLLALKEDYTKRPTREEIINDPTNPRHYWRFSMFPFPGFLCTSMCVFYCMCSCISKFSRMFNVFFS